MKLSCMKLAETLRIFEIHNKEYQVAVCGRPSTSAAFFDVPFHIHLGFDLKGYFEKFENCRRNIVKRVSKLCSMTEVVFLDDITSTQKDCFEKRLVSIYIGHEGKCCLGNFKGKVRRKLPKYLQKSHKDSYARNWSQHLFFND